VIINNIYFDGVILWESYWFNKDCEIFISFSCSVVKCFPLAIEVYWSPWVYRPDIIYLPVQWSHTIWLISSECFNTCYNSIWLHNHSAIYKILKVWYGSIVCIHVMVKVRPSLRMSLMEDIYETFNIPIRCYWEFLNTAHWNHTLHSIFWNKSTNMCIVFLNVRLTSPDHPLMNITWVKIMALRWGWWGWPVESVWIFLTQHWWNSIIEDI